MALNYTISSEKTACGRVATSANATSQTADVTCKTCCKSEAFVTATQAPATAPAAPAAQEVQPASAPADKADLQVNGDQPVRSTSVAFEEWRNQLSCKDRLPRGKFAGHRKQHRPARSRSAA